MIKKKFGNPQASFSERVVRLALAIPAGRVTTYGALARAAGGGPMASQSITSILGKAYDRGETRIPFHRIVYANGRIWIDDRHRAARMKLYKKEKIHIDERDRILKFDEVVLDDLALRELVR